MTINQLPSGNYRIRQMVNGEVYSIVLDHKPRKAEAEALIQAKIKKPAKKLVNLKLKDACRAYNESKSNILSPSTSMGYESIIRNIPDQYNLYLAEITSTFLQKLSNAWAESNSPKTVRNRIGYIYTVLRYYEIDLKQPTTPQNIKEPPYIPTEEEVGRILDHLKPTKYWVGVMLGVFGLRRSEILALTTDDLQGNILTVNKALVPTTKKGEYIIKATKTQASIRTVTLPQEVVDRIREQGFIYDGEPGGLYKNLSRAQKKLGIPHFSFHKLRHFMASYLHQQGFTDKQIQEMGGWRDGSRVMKVVYQHALELENAKKEAAEKLLNLNKK